MKNNIMIVLLLNCLLSASIHTMHEEPMVMLDMEPIGAEKWPIAPGDADSIVVRTEQCFRSLKKNELATILTMPDNMKFSVMRGIIWRFYTVNNGVECKRVVYVNCWVNNKLQILDPTPFEKYQEYKAYSYPHYDKEQN